MFDMITCLITVIAILGCMFNMEKHHRKNDIIGVIKEGFILLSMCIIITLSKM